MEFGELPEECAVREAKEEAGVDVTDVRFLAITNDVFPEEKHHITVWMQGRHRRGDPSICSGHEMTEVGWFSWHALPESRFLSFDQLLQGKSYPPVHMPPTGSS